MAFVATEGCVVLQVSQRDSMSRLNPMYGNMKPVPSAAACSTDVSVVSAATRNITDESCSDPSMSEPDTGVVAVQKPRRKRNFRNTHLVSRDNESESGKMENDEKDVEPVTGVANLGSPSADHDFEVLLAWQRNNRVLLRRLEESASRGKLSMVGYPDRGLIADYIFVFLQLAMSD